jgi:TonB family protein
MALLITIAAGVSVASARTKVSCPAAEPQGASVEWKQFSSADGRFSILMPGTPASRSADFAAKVQFHEFALKLPNASYSVGYLDYADSSNDPEVLRSRFKAARDEMLARNQGSRLIDERELKTGAFTGRELLVLQDQKLLFTIMQAYIVRSRVYELAIQVPVAVAFASGSVTSRLQDRTESFQSTANKFFISFDVPEITETMDDFDRALREFERKNPSVMTVVCSCGEDTPPADTKSEAILNGRAINLVTPPYPSIARSAHASGQVFVQVLIDTEGNVAAARVVKGHPLLRGASVKAALESKFTPPTLEGKPVAVNGIIVYNFVAQ